MEIELNNLVKEDVEEVARIENETFTEPWSKNAIVDTLNEEKMNRTIVAKKIYKNFDEEIENSKVLGYIIFSVSEYETSLFSIAVKEEYRGCGIGEKLIFEMIKIAKNNHSPLIFLEVRKSNEKAISLYKKVGFSIIGERKHFYRKPLEDAYMMRLTL